MIRYCTPHCPSALEQPCRNNYYFGKQLDVYHFQLETDYFNAKRWLLNRLTLGFGVVCGLKVEHCDKNVLSIGAGLAVDGWGREIIVPCEKLYELPVELPPETHYLVAHYRECRTEPAPVHTSECAESEQPNKICESYEMELLGSDDKPPFHEADDDACDVVDDCNWDQDALVEYIAKSCPPCKDDASPVLLAEVRPTPDGDLPFDVEMKRRPIVFRNALLGDLLKCLTKRVHKHNHKK